MRAYDVIKNKRDGKKLTQTEIQFMIKGFVDGSIPDYQMAALLMAVYFKGMDEEETYWLTDCMRTSGDIIALEGIEGVTVDKHSTGGVGDKTSLVLGPVLASLGLKVAKMSGRGLGHTGGTIDKLESIKGFSCELTTEQFIDAVNSTGVVIVGQTGNLVPADKKIYALRDVTATVDSIPLIAASIMSKKLAVANKVLVLDVKVGSGAFMKNLEDARELARLMVKIGTQAGRKVTAVLSNMDEPLGEMIGNAVEVKEAIDTLRNQGPESFTRLIKTLAAQALVMADKVTAEEAEKKVEQVIADKTAYNKFLEMVKIQGGDVSMIEDYSKLPTARQTVELKSDKDGFVKEIHCEEIGLAAMMLGAGRETKDSVIDMAVGLKLIKHVGDEVKSGDTIAEIFVNPDLDNSKAIQRLKDAISISPEKVTAQPLILDIIS
ncbi:MAG: pyrimidine-nucleoside phosphorylase [Clostridiales bacterium]|jgi:pyrimidine-nucleoside phosphorylase|nr:pyrimidine-nucleoside phosphorylase [Clostridiales bacterium]MDN5281582.1 pyrimidine-nucleoside phosphorylase [Candidatus Ozemobacter sp.]